MNSEPQLDPNPRKPMFTLRFLQALARINNLHRPSSSSSLYSRSRKIKRAADVAAAAVTGAKQAWSRAVLRKVRFQARNRGSTRPKTKKLICQAANQQCSQSQADKLRRLVPGGEAMNFCSLLEETADYIQSLTTQVHVMKTLVDSVSP